MEKCDKTVKNGLNFVIYTIEKYIEIGKECSNQEKYITIRL